MDSRGAEYVHKTDSRLCSEYIVYGSRKGHSLYSRDRIFLGPELPYVDMNDSRSIETILEEPGVLDTDGEQAYIDLETVRKNNEAFFSALKKNPIEMIEKIEDVVRESFESRYLNFKGSFEVEKQQIKDLRASDIGSIIEVEGVVADVTETNYEVSSATFQCDRCGKHVSKDQDGGEIAYPDRCNCGNKSFSVADKAYEDVQYFSLKEENTVECRMKGIEDVAKFEGDLVTITGIYTDGGDRLEVLRIDRVDESFDTVDLLDLEELGVTGGDTSNIEAYLDSMSSLQFQKLIAGLFESAGWRIGMQNDADNPVDFTARKQYPYRRQLMVVTKNDREAAIDVEELETYKEYHDRETSITDVLVVAKGEFSESVSDVANSLGIRLIDVHNVKKMIDGYLEAEDDGIIEVNRYEDIESEKKQFKPKMTNEMDELERLMDEVDDGIPIGMLHVIAEDVPGFEPEEVVLKRGLVYYPEDRMIDLLRKTDEE